MIVQGINIMKAFCLVTLVSLVAANADADTQFTAFTAFGGQASHATHQAAPVVHHIAHHAVAHHTVAYQAYEQPKQNCSVLDVVEIADVCTPALDTVRTEKEPIPECTHKDVEHCHYTYVTQFTPSQEAVCEENLEKQCSITFKQQAYNEIVKKCYKSIEKVCHNIVDQHIAATLWTSTTNQQCCHDEQVGVQEQQCSTQVSTVVDTSYTEECVDGVDQVCTEAHVGTTINVLGHLAARPLRGAIAGSRFVKREADAEAGAQGLTPADYTVPHLVSAANVEAAPVAAVRTAVAHHTVAYQGYEQPKQNC